MKGETMSNISDLAARCELAAEHIRKDSNQADELEAAANEVIEALEAAEGSIEDINSAEPGDERWEARGQASEDLGEVTNACDRLEAMIAGALADIRESVQAARAELSL